jgi:enolase
MPKISDVKGRIIYNSRGEKTIEVLIECEGAIGRYASPLGASVGSLEVRPFPSRGIKEAIQLLKGDLRKKLVGFSFDSQEELDEYLNNIDGTGNYSRIGGVLSLGISLAGAEAAAKYMNIPLYHWLGGDDTSLLPVPIGNIVGGGKHARGLSIDIQEVLAFPTNARSISDAVEALIRLHNHVGSLLSQRDEFFTGGRNDEGAWVTSLNEYEVFNLMWEAMDRVKGELGIKFALGADIAATSLWDTELKLYVYNRTKTLRDRNEQINYVLSLIRDFNLRYVEDPLNEQDFPGFVEITKQTKKTMIVGDDLYVSNASRLVLGVSDRAGNAVIIKPNQVGDVTKSRKATEIAKRGGFKVIVSHRSGETAFTHLVPLAVAFKADLIKCGVIGGERIEKLNELIKIERELGDKVKPITFNL